MKRETSALASVATMMKAETKPFSKMQFMQIKRRAEDRGYTVITRWRKGIKRITLAPIILGERK